MTHFALNIRYLRTKNKLNKVAFSKLFGYSANTVSFWESGKNAPSLEVIYKIAEHFKINVGILVSENLEKYENQVSPTTDTLSEDQVSKLSMEEQAIRYNKIKKSEHIAEDANNQQLIINKLIDVVQTNARVMEKTAGAILLCNESAKIIAQTNEKLVNKCINSVQ